MRGEDNDVYHGPTCYTNYYNGASLAHRLGFEKIYFLNYDYVIKNDAYLDNISSILNTKSAYFGDMPNNPEGHSVTTFFMAVRPNFYLNSTEPINCAADCLCGSNDLCDGCSGTAPFKSRWPYYSGTSYTCSGMVNITSGKLSPTACTAYFPSGNMFSGTVTMENGKPRRVKDFSKFLKYPDVIKDLHITKLDALDVIEQYKNDEYAFLYLDPPYLQKGTSNSAYRNMSVDLLNTIFSIIKNKDYKCRIMLHIDFSGWVYAEMKDYIKYYYPAKYMMTCGKNKKNGNTGNGKSYHQRYSALICNY